jgi:TRAP-type C4-dicarboxylate transport system permease small subunit
MSQSTPVLSDETRLSRADRALMRVERALATFSGFVVFALILLAVASVVGRNVFNAPLAGYVDWIEQAMLAIGLFGIAYAQREGAHIRMDLVVGMFRGRALWVAEWVTTALALVFVLLLVWGSWAHFARSFDMDRPMWSRDSSIDIDLPLWPAKLVVPVMLAFLALRLALQLVAYGRAARNGGDLPVAVPLPADQQAQAMAEADLRDAGPPAGGPRP